MALDVSRIILQPTFELTTTDIASHTLTALGQNFESISSWKTWTGPGSLHPKELREILGRRKYFEKTALNLWNSGVLPSLPLAS